MKNTTLTRIEVALHLKTHEEKDLSSRLLAIFFTVCLGGCILAVGYFAWEIFSISRPTLAEIPEENSRIYIEHCYRRKEKAEITDPVDVAFLRHLFGRQYEAVFDNPICPFDIIRISFVHG